MIVSIKKIRPNTISNASNVSDKVYIINRTYVKIELEV